MEKAEALQNVQNLHDVEVHRSAITPHEAQHYADALNGNGTDNLRALYTGPAAIPSLTAHDRKVLFQSLDVIDGAESKPAKKSAKKK